MKRTSILCISMLLIAAFVYFPVTARAASDVYLKIEGSQSGWIQGDSVNESLERFGYIIVHSFGHNIYLPREYSGQLSGKSVHTPLKVLKAFDKASPLLYRVMLTNEPLDCVILRFFDNDPETGLERNYYTIQLDNARIVSVTPSFPTTLISENQSIPHMETVAFSYETITWTYEDGGVTFTDTIQP